MRAHKLVTSLREAISAGKYAPGQKLNEEVLSAEYDVSRNTLREAFGTLEGEKLVTRILYRGVFIVSPDADDIRDLYTAREMIEPGVLLWAELIDVDKLAAIVERAHSAGEAGDVRGVADANQEFHRALVDASGSPSLSEIMDQLLARMRLVFLRMLEHHPDFHGPYVDVNETVTQLLRAGDRQAAADALRRSLAETREAVAEQITQLPPAGDESRSGWL